MSASLNIRFTLNDTAVETRVGTGDSALDVLRRKFDLCSVKLACGEGECGACTILVDRRTRNGCLMPAVDLEGREVLTLEGLWSETGIDPVQQAFVTAGAVQCGFCTPGMILQAKYILSQNKALSEFDIRRGLEGNICRCTGYEKIVAAVAMAAAAQRGQDG